MSVKFMSELCIDFDKPQKYVERYIFYNAVPEAVINAIYRRLHLTF